MFINKGTIDANRVVEELYDLSKPGIISIPNVVREDSRKSLLAGINNIQHHFWDAPRKEGVVDQEMKCFYLEYSNPSALNSFFGQLMTWFWLDYLEVYEKVAEKAKFKERRFNSVGVHYYPRGSRGITPHRDYSTDMDLVSVFILKGKAPFYSCEGRTLDSKVEICSSPGSLILMRAARDESEQRYRPFHSVGSVEEDRYSTIFRRRKNVNDTQPYS